MNVLHYIRLSRNRVTECIAVFFALSILLLLFMAIEICRHNASVRDRWRKHIQVVKGHILDEANSGETHKLPTQWGEIAGSDRDASFRYSNAFDDRIWIFDDDDGQFVLFDLKSNSPMVVMDRPYVVDLHISDGMSVYSIVGRDGYPVYGYVDIERAVVYPVEFSSASRFVSGAAFVTRRNLAGLFFDDLGVKFGVSFDPCWGRRTDLIDVASCRRMQR